MALLTRLARHYDPTIRLKHHGLRTAVLAIDETSPVCETGDLVGRLHGDKQPFSTAKRH